MEIDLMALIAEYGLSGVLILMLGIAIYKTSNSDASAKQANANQQNTVTELFAQASARDAQTDAKLEALMKDNAKLTAHVVRLEANFNSQGIELAHAQEKITELRKMVEELTEELTRIKGDNKVIKNERDKYRAQVESYRSKYETLRAHTIRLDAQLKETRIENGKLRKELHDYHERFFPDEATEE